MFDFFRDNPFLLVILLFWIFNLIFGKKKPKPGDDKGTPKGAQKKSARKERYRELMEKLEQGVENATSPQGKRAAVEPPRAPAPAPVSAEAPSSDPYAFKPVVVDPSARRTASEEVSYDLTAKDYDIAARDYDASGERFSYHSAIEEPAEQEYHLSGFRGFHSAHGLTEKDRAALAATERGAGQGGASATSMLFSGPGELRRAFLLGEILGKPKGLRPPGSRSMGG